MLSGLQIVALRELALVPGYLRKTQLVLTKLAAELVKVSGEPQFCLNMNGCAVHI